ncbi:MAG: SEC-C domain-containing protein [Pseudomonadales bacterium]|nr:SEC-C domain-containing protein [Pseudomonadales bacterium]
MNDSCYCDSGTVFEKCCEPYLKGISIPGTAEQLMRSRYTAYALWDEQYLINTWHSRTRPTNKRVESNDVKWHRLKVKEVLSGGVNDNSGEVVFQAIYKVNGKAHKHNERSIFEKEEGVWRYVDAK